MKRMKLASAVALSVMALMGLIAGSASATTLEVGGATTNSSVSFTWSRIGTLIVWVDTSGFSRNECATSTIGGATSSPFTGSSVTGAVSTMTFEGCTRPVTVHAKGSLEITYTSGTNGTVASEGAEVTVGSAIGTLTCKTGATTNLGTVTGVAAGNAQVDINAVLNCGIIPSYRIFGVYAWTSPSGFGVSA